MIAKAQQQLSCTVAILDNRGTISYAHLEISIKSVEDLLYLYTPKISPDGNEFSQFLNRCSLPKVSGADQAILNAPITLEEIS